jgi:hypothetical protein
MISQPGDVAVVVVHELDDYVRDCDTGEPGTQRTPKSTSTSRYLTPTSSPPSTGRSQRTEFGDRVIERAAGNTLQAIADRLNAQGTTTRTGRSWSPAFVRKVTLQDAGHEEMVA